MKSLDQILFAGPFLMDRSASRCHPDQEAESVRPAQQQRPGQEEDSRAGLNGESVSAASGAKHAGIKKKKKRFKTTGLCGIRRGGSMVMWESVFDVWRHIQDGVQMVRTFSGSDTETEPDRTGATVTRRTVSGNTPPHHHHLNPLCSVSPSRG